MGTTTAIKERPIIFSTEMVRAILEGRKTLTRRVIKESWNGCLTNGGPHPCPNDPIVFYPGESFEINGETAVVDYPEVRALFHVQFRGDLFSDGHAEVKFKDTFKPKRHVS